SEKNLTNNIYLAGDIPNDQMRKFYNKADLVILLSKVEIFGMVILEAMACGCPVIASAVPGAQDVIEDGVNSFIVSDMEATGIAGRIIRICNDSENLQKIKENALKTIREKYCWPVIVRQYYELYLEASNA
ncbi:MAG: glycosyltransferase family 4 protein, partial [bacterium]